MRNNLLFTGKGHISALLFTLFFSILIKSGYSQDVSQVLIPKLSDWSYLDNGSDPGTVWKEIDFDDTAWESGAGQLGYGDDDETTILNFGPDPDNKYISYYFRHKFSLSEVSGIQSLEINLVRDDGAIVYLNGKEVIRSGMPSGTINYQTLATNESGGDDEDTYHFYTVSADLLVDGENVIAVEVHQAEVSSSDISYDLEMISVTGSGSGTNYPASVEPLIRDRWMGYTWPLNAYFPETSADHRHGVVNGHIANSCGPTAFGKVLHYWEFPRKGFGELTFTDIYGETYYANFGATEYNYDLMPAYIPQDAIEDEYHHSATLMYHAATAINDHWVTGGSLGDMKTGFTQYFGFKNSSQVVAKSNYSQNEWIDLLKNELSNNRVIIIAAENLSNGGGHFYLVDGYNAQDEFHIHWDFGEQHGYYPVDNFELYPDNIEALIGLEPDKHGKSLVLNSPTGGVQVPSGEDFTISWDAEGIDNLKIEYTTNGGKDWTEVTPSVSASTGSYTLNITEESDQVKVRVSDAADLNIYSRNREAFTVTGASLANQIVKENITIKYPDSHWEFAEQAAEMLQQKVNFYKSNPESFYPVRYQHHMIEILPDLETFNEQIPASLSVPEFETSFVENGTLYFVAPESPEQLAYFPSDEAALVHGFAKKVISESFNHNLEQWLLYGYAQLEAGMTTDPESLRQQVANLGHKPTISEMNNWEEDSGFNKYDFAYTLVQFIKFKFGHDQISENQLHFSNNTFTTNFWSIQNLDEFEDVWHTNLDIFYLRETLRTQPQDTTEHFIFYMPDEDVDPYLAHFKDLMEETSSRYFDDLNLDIPWKTNFVIYPSACDYNASVGTGGCATNSVGGGIGIDMFQLVTPRDMDRSLEQVNFLAMHEYAHVVQFNIYPRFMPAWLSEGFATFMPYDIIDENLRNDLQEQVNNQMETAKSVLGRYPSIGELGDYDFVRDYNIDYYLIGQIMVDFIVRTHGYESLKALFRSVGQDYTSMGYSSRAEFEIAFYDFYAEFWKTETEPPKEFDLTLISKYSTWKYLDDGSDAGSNWSQPEFDDSDWASGQGQLGYGDNDETTVLNYGSDPDNKFITYYFRHTFNISDASVITEPQINLVRDDGAVVYINGTEVIRSGMGDGTITYQTLASNESGGNDEVTYHPYTITADLFVDGENVIAVEVHQTEVVSSDISFDLELLAIEGTSTSHELEPDELSDEIKEFELLQNYPNPFNPSTQIKYTIPEASTVSLEIFNTTGQQVQQLVERIQSSGSYTIQWNAGELPSGVYLIKLRATSFQYGKQFTDIKKALLIK